MYRGTFEINWISLKVKKVACMVTLPLYGSNPFAVIEIGNVSKKDIRYSYGIKLNYLNEGQGGTVGVRVEPYQATVPDTPNVYLGAPGVNGAERELGSSTSWKVSWWIVVAIVIAEASVLSYIMKLYYSSRTKKPQNRSPPSPTS